MSHLLVAPPVTEGRLAVVSLVNSFLLLDAKKHRACQCESILGLLFCFVFLLLLCIFFSSSAKLSSSNLLLSTCAHCEMSGVQQ